MKGKTRMCKKLLSVSLLLAILLSLSSCIPAPFLALFAQEILEEYTQVEASDYNQTKSYTYQQFHFGYDALNKEEQQVYKQLEQAAYKIADKKDEYGLYPIATIQADLSFSEARFYKVMTAFEIDNPQVFWLENTYTYIDYTKLRRFQVSSFLSAEECTAKQKLFHKTVKEIISAVPKGLSEYERELFLHDYVIETCTYVDDNRWERYSPYGALVKKQAVCEGYSEALQLLFNCVGIESSVLFGYTEDEAHEWNIVKLDGDWYHLDATWDDWDEEALTSETHFYFNMDDTGITENDHVVSPLYSELTEEEVINDGEEYIEMFNLFVPACNSLEQNFFYRNGAFITRLDGTLEAQPLKKMMQLAKKKEPEIYLIIDKDLDMQQADSALFEQDPYLYFNYAQAVNASGIIKHTLNTGATTTYDMPGYSRLIIADLLYQ